ncbi:MAG: hypothetical protein GXO00_02790, partial [Candidatus Diapherotrites archaeon]|nr:hypothetical protein [Candidatus Diapherotrites archaeon]
HSLDIVIFMRRANVKGFEVRRIGEIDEIIDVDIEKKKPIVNVFVEWIPAEDKYRINRKSKVIAKIVRERGVSIESVWEELRRRAYVIEYLVKNNIRYYREVQRYIARYYKEPDKLLEEIGYAKSSG